MKRYSEMSEAIHITRYSRIQMETEHRDFCRKLNGRGTMFMSIRHDSLKPGLSDVAVQYFVYREGIQKVMEDVYGIFCVIDGEHEEDFTFDGTSDELLDKELMYGKMMFDKNAGYLVEDMKKLDTKDQREITRVYMSALYVHKPGEMVKEFVNSFKYMLEASARTFHSEYLPEIYWYMLEVLHILLDREIPREAVRTLMQVSRKEAFDACIACNGTGIGYGYGRILCMAVRTLSLLESMCLA